MKRNENTAEWDYEVCLSISQNKSKKNPPKYFKGKIKSVVDILPLLDAGSFQ